MVTCLSDTHSLLSIFVSELRNLSVQQDRLRFRRNMERIGEITALEISRVLHYNVIPVQTPMGTAECAQLSAQPVIATILRAGVPLQTGLLNYFGRADAAFIAAYRKHGRDGSFIIQQEYITTPPIADRPLIIADPMLATGASLTEAVNGLLEYGIPSSLHIVTAIASSEGLAFIQRHFPQAWIWTAAIDEELTARGYIVPGLGDAGDLAYGSKMQS